MSVDWGYTVPPEEAGGDVAKALAEANAPRHGDRTPREWVKANLFNNWYNSIITIVFGAFAIWAGYYALRFVFSTAQWQAVADNLELFMIGTFPREERTRIVAQVILWGGAAGLLVGYFRARARRQADEAGVELVPVTVRESIGTYGSIAAFVIASLAIGARTAGPGVRFLPGSFPGRRRFERLRQHALGPASLRALRQGTLQALLPGAARLHRSGAREA